MSGAIGSLSFSYDLMFLGSTGITGASSGFYRPALRQGGINYVLFVPFDSTTSSGWTTFTHLSGSPLEWNDPTGTLHPDFSATGGAISFGYRVGFGVSCGSTQCSAATSVGVLDNYVVQIDGIPETSGVPEPASMWLAATSLALLRAVRKI